MKDVNNDNQRLHDSYYAGCIQINLSSLTMILTHSSVDVLT